MVRFRAHLLPTVQTVGGLGSIRWIAADSTPVNSIRRILARETSFWNFQIFDRKFRLLVV